MPEQYQYQTAVYFGDSLTDNGNFYNLTSSTLSISLPRDSFGYNQRYSDGLVYSDYATQFLDLDSQLNYAVTGARAIGDRSFLELVYELRLDSFLEVPGSDPLLAQGIDLAGQVARFLSDSAGEDLSQVSATLTFGSNDYAEFKPWLVTNYIEDSKAYVAEIIGEITKAARTLDAAGVGQVVITGLPSANFAPTYYDSPFRSPMSNYSLAYHNNQLERAVDMLQSEGINAVFVHMEAMGRAIARDPLNFGITAPLEQSYLLDTSGTDPIFNPAVEDIPLDQIAFLDGRHPTDVVHAMLGAFHAASLTSTVYVGNEFGNRKTFGDEQNLVMASGGSDRISVNGGDDIVFGEHGTDDISGGAGMDILSGGSEGDVLRGGDGDDVVHGGSGNDLIYGDDGADVLLDGLGSDSVYGGAGDDLFIFHQASLIGGADGVDLDYFDAGEGTDTLVLLLTEANAAEYAADLDEFGALVALTNQGIAATGFEDVRVVTDRAELDQFNDLARLGEADVWGLV
ncbi:SGNH/GDSL hydrolase family protein [Dinoroseobacter sp. S76]|uniref:SGNH/GDSL hydrolase family protein n=1 Tax=Dinoroseobacter sp. S76 TaxID=3415124 RepID=UPI003C7B4336